jgi:hypothetical protein
MNNSGSESFAGLPSGETEKVTYFFLDKILRARIGRHIESGRHDCDEEVNMYLAGLLRSVVSSGEFVREKPYVSPFDFDVRKYLEAHPGSSNEYVVYRDNADFGLIALGVFIGYRHDGSYHSRACAHQDSAGRVAVYYHLAASALEHIQRTTLGLSDAFNTMADNIREIIGILRTVAGDYFDIMERLGDGSLFHLEREVRQAGVERTFKDEMDRFLGLYGEYHRLPSVDNKEKVLLQIGVLKNLDPDFRFDESSL